MKTHTRSPAETRPRAHRAAVRWCRLLLAIAIVSSVGTTVARAWDDVYAAPTADEVRAKALEWVTAHQVPDRATLQRIDAMWRFEDGAPAGRELLQTLIDTFALADSKTRQFVEACALPRPQQSGEDLESLRRDDGGPFYTANLDLYYARFLAQSQMYDEAL